ncbi:hypothetical protein RIF29_20133 [Crotalaria pallida]|uniref:Uncharacterized protein n=1 Tax=Crotalaria pallida TaxID=3830 RepID=A0AAN9I766_CROPI
MCFGQEYFGYILLFSFGAGGPSLIFSLWNIRCSLSLSLPITLELSSHTHTHTLSLSSHHRLSSSRTHSISLVLSHESFSAHFPQQRCLRQRQRQRRRCLSHLRISPSPPPLSSLLNGLDLISVAFPLQSSSSWCLFELIMLLHYDIAPASFISLKQ